MTDELFLAMKKGLSKELVKQIDSKSPDIDALAKAALAVAIPAALEMALECQPSTAEDPKEDAYQHGRFRGIMDFAQAIAALKPTPTIEAMAERKRG